MVALVVVMAVAVTAVMTGATDVVVNVKLPDVAETLELLAEMAA
jgi:hypothetical protein